MKFLKASLAIALVISTITFLTSAVAAVKPGDACKKLGSTSVNGSLKFTCITSGKKLIWNKGSKVVSAIITPAPKATPSQTPSPVATPTQVSEPFQPTTFDDLIAHPESMSYWAWKKSGTQIKNSTKIAPEVFIHLGPTTVTTRTNTAFGISAAAKLYDSFTLPVKINVIYFAYSDRAWAQAQFAKYAINVRGSEAEEMCRDENSCVNAMAEIDLKGNGLILIALGASNRRDPNENSGTLEAHEFTHNIQASQFIGTNREQNSHCCFKRYVPHWMVEGGAEFAQAASIFPDSYQSYLSERKFDIQELIANKDKKFTASWIEKFLDPESISMWNDPSNNWRIYDVGFLANEAFVALKGPAISLQLHRDIALGASWSEAFKKNFDIDWIDAAPKLAKAISTQLTN